MSEAKASGLDDVVAADTAISDVDGERGRLVIAGADVEQLALSSDFETAVARVLAAGNGDAAGATAAGVGAGAGGAAGTGAAAELRTALARARTAAWEVVPRLGDALEAADGMDALRAALAHLRASGDDGVDAITAIGAAPVFVGAWNRKRAGAAPVAPNAVLGHAADYLRMSLGTTPSDDAVRALDAYLVTVIDHGMNASTFTARVVTSTASDLISAVVAAV